jgi:hypothetical protein
MQIAYICPIHKIDISRRNESGQRDTFFYVIFAQRVRNNKIHNPFHKPMHHWCVSSKKQCVVIDARAAR